MNLTKLPPTERLEKPYSKDRDELLKDFLKRRNSQLINLFRDTGHQVKLLGEAENPVIILNNKIKLTAYVHNFELRFTDAPWNGDVICRVKINASNHISPKFLELFLKEVEQEPANGKKKRRRIPKFEKVERKRKSA
jgi:hypothetical protein